MAANSDGLVETVLTCEGDLKDPDFPHKFKQILANLKQILFKGGVENLNLHKVEPWNSVRVTFTIPKEAAVRLRHLAQQGNSELTQLGILSVQVEGDEVISLRIASRFGGDPQEIVMHTGPSTSTSSSSSSSLNSMSSPETGEGTSSSNVIRSIAQSLNQVPSTSNSAFKSPNVVAPLDSDPIPYPPAKAPPPASNHSGSKSPAQPNVYQRPFPFASMTHAAHTIQNRESIHTVSQQQSASPATIIAPPPPYPGPSRLPDAKCSTNPANVALSSPLLVNLLQNDAFVSASNKGAQTQSMQVKNKPGVMVSKPSEQEVQNMVSGSAFCQTKLSDSSNHLNPPNIPISLAQTKQPTFLSQSVVNQALFQRQIQQSASSQTPMMHMSFMQSHSGAQTSMASPINPLPSPKHIDSLQTNKSNCNPLVPMQQQRFSSPPLVSTSLNASPLLSSPSALSGLQPSLLRSSVTEQSIVPQQIPFERPPQSHRHTMVEAKDFPSQNILKLPLDNVSPSSVIAPSHIIQSTPPLQHIPKFLPDMKTTIGNENKTETVKFNETSQIERDNQPLLLINPLTGDLEPIPSDVESSDNEVEMSASSVSNALDDSFFNFPSPFNDRSNSLFSDDDDMSSVISRRADTTTDQSDSENTPRSTSSDSTLAKHSAAHASEKIKLRLKLEKSEPVTPAYKVDVSFVNTYPLRKTSRGTTTAITTSVLNTPSNSTSPIVSTPPPSKIEPLMNPVVPTSDTTTTTMPIPLNSAGLEEPKVPPLHISLRGRNAAVVVNCKDEKKWKEGFKASGANSVNKKAKSGGAFKENSSNGGVKKSLMFMSQPVEEDDDEEDDEDEEEEEDDEEEEDEEDEQDAEDSDDEEEEDENEDDDSKRGDLEQNLKNRLEPGEIVSPYSTPIRTAYPTAEEVTSILRSMPSDTHHKMSLSCPKDIKKKDAPKRQLYSRERLVEDPMSLFNKSPARSKTNKLSNSLLKNVVKTAAKEARMLAAVRQNTFEKQRAALGNGVQQRKLSTDKDIQSPSVGPIPLKKLKPRQLREASSNKSVPLNHNSSDCVKKVVNNVNKVNCNVMKSKELSVRSNSSSTSLSATVMSMSPSQFSSGTNMSANFSKDISSGIFTNASSQPISTSSNVKKKDFFNILDCKVDLPSCKSHLKSFNSSLETIRALEKNSLLLPIIHDIELTEKKIKQKLLEESKNCGVHAQAHVMSGDLKHSTGGGVHSMEFKTKSAIVNTRNSTDSRTGDVRNSTENNGNQSEPGNSQGEDSGIESMDALSEKSPNQSSESPLYKNNDREDSKCHSAVIHPMKGESIERMSSVDLSHTVKREPLVSENKGVKSGTMQSSNLMKTGSSMKREPRLEVKHHSSESSRSANVKQENVSIASPASEDPQPIRITPALYTYSNSEKVREDTPSPSPADEEELEATTLTRAKRKRKLDVISEKLDTPKSEVLTGEDHLKLRTSTSKSLLEQLLIEIPNEGRVEPKRSMTTRNTRSQNKFCDISPDVATSASSTSSPHCSPSLEKSSKDANDCKPSPNSHSKQRNAGKSKKNQENSQSPANLSVNSSDDSNTIRPSKRKCSENAAELIKACMGVDDHPAKKHHLPEPASLLNTVQPNLVSPVAAKTPKKKGPDAENSLSEDEVLSDILVKNKICDTNIRTSTCTTSSSVTDKCNSTSSSSSSTSAPACCSTSSTIARVSSTSFIPSTNSASTVTSSTPSTITTSSSTLSTSNNSGSSGGATVSIITNSINTGSTTTSSVMGTSTVSPTGATSSSSSSSSSSSNSASSNVRQSSRITESKQSKSRRSNRQNKQSNESGGGGLVKANSKMNNNNKSNCNLMNSKNNNCITRGATKAAVHSDEQPTVRRKTRSANVNDADPSVAKRRRSSKDSK